MIAATDSINALVGQFADQKPVFDKALPRFRMRWPCCRDSGPTSPIPRSLGKFSALTADAVNKTKEKPCHRAQGLRAHFGVAGQRRPGMTRSLSLLPTYPWPNETLDNWVRGDYGNLTGIFDLTLSRSTRRCLPAPGGKAT